MHHAQDAIVIKGGDVVQIRKEGLRQFLHLGQPLGSGIDPVIVSRRIELGLDDPHEVPCQIRVRP